MGRLNGSSYDGAAAQYAEDVNSPDRINAVSAPVLVSAGDQLAVSGTLGASPLSWRQVEVFAAGLRGALVARVTSGFGIGTVATAVEWNSAVYDTGDCHDPVGAPSRLTAPAGTSSLVRLSELVGCGAEETTTVSGSTAASEG